MRFFCTCDCRKVREDSENALRKIKGLEADLTDLWDRFVRLQGRWAKSHRQDAPGATNGDEVGVVADPGQAHRDEMQRRILERRNRGVLPR
jgi:hypothetical protein